MSEIDLLQSITEEFSLKEIDANVYSPLSLAFVGDSVYGLIVKTVITMQGNCPANQLNAKTTQFVKAVSQAKVYDLLTNQDILTSEEADIMRRGRNAKASSTAKNASVGDYRKATGVEALVGYLYLKGNTKRTVEIMKLAMDELLE